MWSEAESCFRNDLHQQCRRSSLPDEIAAVTENFVSKLAAASIV
jgi:hypothetical protein